MKTLTADHPLVVPEGFKADASAYGLIITDFNEELDIVIKKIKYTNGDKVKWCARIVQEVVITRGLNKATSKKTDNDYYFFECKEINGDGTKMRSLVGDGYIAGIEEKGGDPTEVFAKGEEVTNESFYAMVDGNIVARNQGSGSITGGVTLTDSMTKALEAFTSSSEEEVEEVEEVEAVEADTAKQPQ